MAIKNIAKAESLLRTLAEELKIRTAGSAAGFVDTVREARDTEGYPFIVLSDNGNEAAGQPVLFIRIKQIDAISKDIFGNDLKAYAPHVCELAYELDSGNQAFVRRLDLAKVMFELVKLGVKIKVKEIANGTAVTAANVDAASTALELDWLRWPTKGV
jgi:hypothetical protein